MRVAPDFVKRDDGVGALDDQGIVAGEAEEGVRAAKERKRSEKRGEQQHLAGPVLEL